MRKRLSETFTWYERYDSCFKPLPMQYKRKLTTPSFSWWYSLIKTLDRLEKGNPFWKRYVCFENVCADPTPAIINQYCPDQIYSVSTWLYHQGTVSRIKTDWLFWSWKKAQLTPTQPRVQNTEYDCYQRLLHHVRNSNEKLKAQPKQTIVLSLTTVGRGIRFHTFHIPNNNWRNGKKEKKQQQQRSQLLFTCKRCKWEV